MNITTTLAWLITAHFIQGLIGELQYTRTPHKKGLLHNNDPTSVWNPSGNILKVAQNSFQLLNLDGSL